MMNKTLAFSAIVMFAVMMGGAAIAPAYAGGPAIPNNCSGKADDLGQTDGVDIINETAGNDNIHGQDGDDTIFANSQSLNPDTDKIRGGSGNDTIFVDGYDRVCAGDGDDIIYSWNSFPDTITCSDGENDFAIVDEIDKVTDPENCETLIVIPTEH